jgi:hypothetical protein
LPIALLTCLFAVKGDLAKATNEKARTKSFAGSKDKRAAKKLKVASALGFALLPPGSQPVFNPDLMSATQRLRVNKEDTRRTAQKRKTTSEPVLEHLEENLILTNKLARIEDLSVLRRKRHVYSNPEKRFVECFSNREVARCHLHTKKGIFISSGQLSDWMAQHKFGKFLPSVEPNRLGSNGKPVKNAAGNKSAYDGDFERVLCARVVLLRRLRCPIQNGRISLLAKQIRDVEQKERWKDSKIKKCHFKSKWVVSFKNRNG